MKRKLRYIVTYIWVKRLLVQEKK